VFPAIALLVSGGHTELILIRTWNDYQKIGSTRDDAVGEAFDKVARMLGLPYPGGPEISRLAAEARERDIQPTVRLPRPMLESGDLDFSFSGLKTAVRYAVQDRELLQQEKLGIAREFEDAVTTVLLKKTKMAVDLHKARTIIVGGGVSANTYIRETFKAFFWKEYPMVPVYLPPRNLSTDNSVMIALAGHAKDSRPKTAATCPVIIADGNLTLGVET
jgi:N6-L-threonylcarbamoyladenine synthase